MDNYNGYKLKPEEYSIQPNDIIIRVIPGVVAVPIGTIAVALEDECIAIAAHQCWAADFKHWRAIETLPGSEARASDTVYCIKNTHGSCNKHDSFVVSKCNSKSTAIYPIKGHVLLNGETTKSDWSWLTQYFVVLVKSDAKEIQEFPCFRRAIKDKHIVKFVSPSEGTVIFKGNSEYDLSFISSWVDCNNTNVWEPCSDPREIEKVTPVPVDPFEAKPGDYVEWDDNAYSRMTKGQLYKVVKTGPSFLTILNNLNRRDTWSKERFKRVSDKTSQEPVLISSDDHIDSLAYALRGPTSYIAIDSMMNKPTTVDSLQSLIDEVAQSYGPVEHPIASTIKQQTNSKGKQMNSNLFTDILKLLMQTEQTDLEKAPSTYAFFYNNEGEYEGTARVTDEAEAKALLQKPEHLGYTMRIYSFSDEFTTQIPVVSTIKKTVVAKPASKPRATKA